MRDPAETALTTNTKTHTKKGAAIGRPFSFQIRNRLHLIQHMLRAGDFEIAGCLDIQLFDHAVIDHH